MQNRRYSSKLKNVARIRVSGREKFLSGSAWEKESSERERESQPIKFAQQSKF